MSEREQIISLLDRVPDYDLKNPQAALELVNMIDEAIASHVHFIDYLS